MEERKAILADIIAKERAMTVELGTQRLAQTKLTKKVSTLEERATELNKQLQTAQEALIELDGDSTAKSQEISRQRAEIVDLHAQISELQTNKRQAQEDIELLEEEATKLENQIIDLDADFQTKKEEKNHQLQELATRLQGAFDKLKETQEKDDSIRKSWAENLMKLEKREQVIAKREIKVQEGENRVRQYNDFMRL